MGAAERRGGAAQRLGGLVVVDGPAADDPRNGAGRTEVQTAWARTSLADSALVVATTRRQLVTSRLMIERARQTMRRDDQDVRTTRDAVARSRRQLGGAERV